LVIVIGTQVNPGGGLDVSITVTASRSRAGCHECFWWAVGAWNEPGEIVLPGHTTLVEVAALVPVVLLAVFGWNLRLQFMPRTSVSLTEFVAVIAGERFLLCFVEFPCGRGSLGPGDDIWAPCTVPSRR
jgi:hypothetical protein